MPSKLMEYFNKSPRIGALSTADKAGKVDSGIFGSPRMTDERTVVMGTCHLLEVVEIGEWPQINALADKYGQNVKVVQD